VALPKVCFIGLKCLDLLAGVERPRYLGGVEKQLVFLASGLARRGWHICMVSYDQGQGDAVECGDVRVYRAYSREEGLYGLRFFHPRWSGLWEAMGRANADIYYQMGAGCETGQTALWCGSRNRRFVFAAASDPDCLSGLPRLRLRRERFLCRFGIRAADAIVSQTGYQKGLLVREYGVDSDVIGGACPEPRGGLTSWRRTGSGHAPHVLWIGRICEVKRPELVLDLAGRLPECIFDVIGDSNEQTAFAREFRRRAGAFANVVLHGKVSEEHVDRAYSEAALLMNTSSVEGFPVTFLEAWSRGIPAVSMVDPDGVIARHGLGAVGSDGASLAASVTRLLDNRAAWQACSANARSYYLANHTLDRALDAHESLFVSLARRARRHSALARATRQPRQQASS